MHQLPPDLLNLTTDSRRLLHGRGGHFEGLEHVAIDWFAPVILVTLYAEAEVNSLFIADLSNAAGCVEKVHAIVVQKRFLTGAPKETVYGKLPDEVYASENGLRYELCLDRNQNHGFFLDMKAGRDWVRSISKGQKVLNLFSYTCSLSVAAIAGGAESVVNLDMASGALSTGRNNHHLNFPSETCRRASYLAHDLF